MTQTFGYYCDECRTKYVRHICKDGLPCHHDIDDAVFVSAKMYGKGGEIVRMEYHKQPYDIFVDEYRRYNEEIPIGSRFKIKFFATPQQGDNAETIPLAWWLRQQPLIIVRAFLSRWKSEQEPVEWIRALEPERILCKNCGQPYDAMTEDCLCKAGDGNRTR